jgi:hypothetical protein
MLALLLTGSMVSLGMTGSKAVCAESSITLAWERITAMCQENKQLPNAAM